MCASDWLKISRTSGVPIDIPVGMGAPIDMSVESTLALVLRLSVFPLIIKQGPVYDSQKLLTSKNKLVLYGPCFGITLLSVANLSSSTALNMEK